MKTWLYIAVLVLNTTFAFAQISLLPYQAIETGSHADVVSIADINNDGLGDVVLGTGYYFDPVNDYKLFVFIQNQQGALNAPVIYPYPVVYPGISSIATADVNNDLLNDVIIGYGDSIGVFFQNTSGTLSSVQSFYSGVRVDGVKCGDLNNDGLTDIAVSHQTESFIRVFYQHTTGFTDTSYPKPLGGFSEIDVGDVNDDGLDDVIFMAGSGQVGGIHVYTQNSSGLLNPSVAYHPAISTWDQLHGIAIGDLNNDNRNDLVATMGGNSGSSKMVMWFQDTVTALLQEPPQEFAVYDIPEPVEIADLNCDGKNEVIIAHGGWVKMSVFEQGNQSQYSIEQRFDVPYASHYEPQGMSIGDFTGDGRKDIAIADYNHGLILLVNNSPSNSPTEITETYVVVDTIYSNDLLTTSQYDTSTSFEIRGYQVTATSTYLVTNMVHEDSIRTDSVFVSITDVCGTLYTDTATVSYFNTTQSNTSSDTAFVSSVTDTVNLTTAISIYPNPTTGRVVINLPSPFDTKQMNLFVRDDAGRLVLSVSYADNANRRELDLSGWANGTYIISVRVGKSNSISKKVIKN